MSSWSPGLKVPISQTIFPVVNVQNSARLHIWFYLLVLSNSVSILDLNMSCGPQKCAILDRKSMHSSSTDPYNVKNKGGNSDPTFWWMIKRDLMSSCGNFLYFFPWFLHCIFICDHAAVLHITIVNREVSFNQIAIVFHWPFIE